MTPIVADGLTDKCLPRLFEVNPNFSRGLADFAERFKQFASRLMEQMQISLQFLDAPCKIGLIR